MTDDPKPEQPQLHIDDDWKAEAQREKQRLAEQTDEQSSDPQGGPGQLPPSDFQTLVSTMITQAMMAMGAMPDPQTGQRVAILDLAKFHIDMLGVLEEKTRGNLDDEETKLLTSALRELRMHYVEISKQAAVQMQQQSQGGGAGGDQPNLRMPDA